MYYILYHVFVYVSIVYKMLSGVTHLSNLFDLFYSFCHIKVLLVYYGYTNAYTGPWRVDKFKIFLIFSQVPHYLYSKVHRFSIPFKKTF